MKWKPTGDGNVREFKKLYIFIYTDTQIFFFVKNGVFVWEVAWGVSEFKVISNIVESTCFFFYNVSTSS